jgi:hypothetical protein
MQMTDDLDHRIELDSGTIGQIRELETVADALAQTHREQATAIPNGGWLRGWSENFHDDSVGALEAHGEDVGRDAGRRTERGIDVFQAEGRGETWLRRTGRGGRE